MSIYDDYIEKDGRKFKKVKLLYVDSDEEPCLCDGCDEKKPCAHFDDLLRNVTVLCKDCLQEIIDQF